jgi:trehalose 6-phosphate phosphatase
VALPVADRAPVKRQNNAVADGNTSPLMPVRRSFSLQSDAFLLDVDGTILDIAPSPEEVHVPASLKRTLALLQEQTDNAVALVSGREIDVLDRLFAPLALSAIGCHGAEWRVEPGAAIEVRSQALSGEIKRACLALAAGEPLIRLEDKRYTLAFHYRRAPDRGPNLESRLRELIAPFASDLSLLRGKLVMEIKPRRFDKGEAISALMRQAGFAARRAVFLGDDVTDQDGFAAVRELGGVGISVGRPMADAEMMLPTPRAARLWLARLAGNSNASAA